MASAYRYGVYSMSYNVTIPDDIKSHVISLINKGVGLRAMYEKKDIILNGKPISYNQLCKVSKSIENKLPWNSKLRDAGYYGRVSSVKDYDRLRKPMYFMAHKYATKREDVDELVNEIWLFGNVQRAKEGMIFRCIMHDIKRWRANRDHTRSKRRYEANRGPSIDALREDLEGESDWEIAYDDKREEFEQRDLIEVYSSDMAREDKLITRLKFYAGLDHNDICKTVGCTRTHIFNRLVKIKQVIKNKILLQKVA